MRVLYHSAPPMADTGYGVHTRHLATRLNQDHDVDIYSVGGWEGMGIDYEGMQVFPAGLGKHGEHSIPYWFDESDADVVFSHHDHWAMADVFRGIQQNGIPTVLYTILDHDHPGGLAPEAVVKANENAFRTIVMSEWAESRVKQSRIPDSQVRRVPHGVDTTKYAPVTPDYVDGEGITEAELKADLGIPEDAFLFGMVAANHGPRKNIPQHMEAFKRFTEEYDADDAYFMVHAHPTMGGGFNLFEVRDALDLDDDRCIFPDPHRKYHGIPDLTIVQLYNTFDVYLNCSQSESWGLTITEAMACGTPVIATNFSAMTEQFGVPFDTYVEQDEQYRVTDQGLLVHRGNEIWTQNATARRFTPRVEDIKEAMAYYYVNREEIDRHGANAREWVVRNYEWDYLYEEHWLPIFDEIDEELGDETYNEYYFKRRDAETQSTEFQQEAHKILFSVRGDTVLDVGAGSGTMAELLAEYDYDDVVAVEPAEAGREMVEEKGIEVYDDSLPDLRFKDGAFDTVLAQHVLEHVEGDAAALRELARVADQRVVVVVPKKRPYEETADKTEVRAGYDDSELERLYDEFETLGGRGTIDERELQVNPNTTNWLITIDVASAEAETGEMEAADD